MKIIAALVLLFPVSIGQLSPPAPTIQLAVVDGGICDLFPYLPGCPR